MTPEEARALLAAVPMPLLLLGRDGRIRAANPRAEALFGTALAGRLYGSVLRQPGLLSPIEAALAGRAAPGRPATGQFTLSAASGDSRYRVTAEPLEGGQGVLVAVEDVSHLSDVVQQRRDFVANVSHELRTPLTALMGFIETLQGPARDDPAARERFLATMAREAERMNRLVADLLSLSRVEAEERIRPTDPVDLAAVLGEVRAALAPAAEEAGATLDFALPEGRITVPGDADQLMQVFINLVENAIKYGGRRVEVIMHPPAAEPALRGEAVRVDVIDNGEGIAPEHVPRLTERFYRVDSHRSREMGGTGLGLAIVKHILSRHRGRLKIASTPGKGSRFSVILPTS